MSQKFLLFLAVFLILGVSIANAVQPDGQPQKNGKSDIEQNSTVESPIPETQPMFKIGAFGSLGVLHSTQSDGDYVLESSMPGGAGKSNAWDVNNYSKLAVQFNAYFSPKISGQFQILAAYESNATFQPEIEWVNLKYAFNQDVYIRAGRFGLPTFFDSGNHDVGYSYAWAHPPSELYYLLPLLSSDGIESMYRFKIGTAKNSVKVFYGTSVHDGRYVSATSHGMWGISDSFEYDQITFHADYQKRNTTTEILQSGLTDSGIDCTDLSLGVSYDPDDWFIVSEWIQSRTQYKSNAMYVGTGYHFNKFTPFLVHSQNTTGSFPQGYTPSSTGIDLQSLARRSQQTNSLGVRWDFKKNADLKFQYDQVTLGDYSNGFLVNVPATANLYGSSFSLFSAVVDFVF
jgi:hypothetical protein